MLRGTEGERKNNTRSQGEEGTIWPGYFLRSPEGDEPNISFWVLGDTELTYSSLKAAQLSVFRLFVSSSLSSSCPFHHFFAYFFILDFGSTLFFKTWLTCPAEGRTSFIWKNELWLRVISSSFWHPSLLLFNGEIIALFFKCTPKAKRYEIKFPKLSFCLSKLLLVAQGLVRVRGRKNWRVSEKKSV